MSSYSANPAFHSASKKPAFSHSRNRLCTALALPKRSAGSAFHWQPVRKTCITASNTCRAGLGGRPAPGLRVNVLSGARVRTGISGSTLCQKSSVTTQDSTRFFAGEGHDPLQDEMRALTPLRALATADDVAASISFLCSDGARFVNGQTIMVDGGVLLTSPAPTHLPPID